MASQPKTCRECSKPLSPRSRSGLCRVHVKKSPEFRERLSQALRSSYAANPEWRERKSRASRISANRPEERERRSRQAKEFGLHQIGVAALTAESFAKAGARAAATRMAWCPPHLRAEYRFLTQKKGLRAPDARRIIEAQNEAEMQRWRRAHGLVEEEVVLPKVKAPALSLPADLPFIEKVLPAVSKLTCISVRDLIDRAKFSHIVRARFAAIYAIKRHYGDEMSAAAIGRFLGGRDHSTILHALKEAEKLVRQDEDFADLVAKVLAA